VNRTGIAALAFIALGASPQGQRQDKDWPTFNKQYPVTILANILARARAVMASQNADRVLVPAERSRFCGIYSGTLRPTGDFRRKLLQDSLKTSGENPSLADRYAQEMLVRDGKVEHWLPLEQALDKPLREQIAAGSRLELYVAWYGSVGQDVVLAVEEFQPKCLR